MREVGRVVAIEDNQAKILIKRGTACGECGACQVGREKLEMVMVAENNIGAKVDDEVIIDLENMNFMTAMVIAYGFPLLALIVGIIAGYYGLLAVGLREGTAQVGASLIGLVFLACSYAVIKFKEEAIKKMKKFRPIIVGIKTKDSI